MQNSQTINRFDLGLLLGPPEDSLPDGAMRSCRGMHTLSLGSFRSRPGSALLFSLAAHSLFYFADVWYSGVSTSLYRAAVSIKSALSGNRLSFAKAPPVAGIVDYLFVAGGGDLFKSDSSGNVTDWGFDAPLGGPTLTLAAGGSLTDGSTYQYKITYKNSVTGHRSNGNTTAASETAAGANLTINLSGIPDGSLVDPQIDTVEIWRTVADGTSFFLLDTVTSGTPTYTDDGSESLSSTELPTDNLKPFSYFDDCLGPHNASMFWITRTQPGQRGRLFYSPVGRVESLDGFIEVTSDDNPLQRIFRLQGKVGVIAESGIFMIGGTNPYIPREIHGAPGTTSPHTVAVTPRGVFYEASDGIRVFDGTSSTLVEEGSIERLFRGEAIGDFTAFTGIVGAYARNEYFISDGAQTFAFDLSRRRFRDLGAGLNAIFYSEESDQIAATISSVILDLEKEGEINDNAAAIPLIIEPKHLNIAVNKQNLLQHLIFDIDTGGEQLTLTLLHDGNTTAAGVLNTAQRSKVTVPIGIPGQKFGFRLTGSLSTAQIELFSVTVQFNDAVSEKG